jgi:hypothetical protein
MGFLASQGDVYHLVFNLCEWLDGRVWPAEDELDVLRLVDLIHHVTGTNPRVCITAHRFSLKGVSWIGQGRPTRQGSYLICNTCWMFSDSNVL